MTSIDEVIQLAATSNKNGRLVPKLEKKRNFYFFFTQENELKHASEIQPQDLKKENVRHMSTYKGKYYDYIAGKDYDTLEKWATDNGRSVDDIRYGVSYVSTYGEYTVSITLPELLEMLNPSFAEKMKEDQKKEYVETVVTEYLSSIVEMMKLQKESIDKILEIIQK
jgi:hypothetical protein